MEDIVAIVMVFSIPLAAIFTAHLRKMAEIKLRLQQDRAASATGDMEEMRRQVTELRDITTKYDLSFDQALQRIEARTARLEERVIVLERTGAPVAEPTGLQTRAGCH